MISLNQTKQSKINKGTEFFGAINFYARFRVIDVFRKEKITKAGNKMFSKEIYVSFQNLETGKTYCTDMDTLCRCNIEIIED